MKNTIFKKVISIVLVLLLSISVVYLPGMSLSASAACSGGCQFTAQKIGVKYLKSEKTCGKQAVYYYSCAVCGLSSGETNEAKTFTYGEKPEHNWGPTQTVPATCTAPESTVRTCTRCGEKYVKKGSGDPLGHNEKYISNGDGTHTKICTRAGCTLYEVSDCSTKETVCGYAPLCDYCNTTYGSTLGHDLDIAVIPATCTEGGFTKSTCKRCNYVEEYNNIPALGHDKKITNAIAPTCVYEGYHLYTCARCGIEDRETLPALGHEYEYTPDGNATCTQDGTRTGKCIRCPKTISDYEPGSALGHSFTLYISNNNATCTQNGTEWATCDRGCGAKDVREIPNSALGHNYVGNLCTRCNAVKDEDSSVCKHTYPDNWTVIITPDCQNKGAQVKVCTLCKNIISESLPKTGHIDTDGDSKCDTCDKTIVVVDSDKTEEKPCDCNCHAGGIKAFFFKLINFFAKIFDKNARVCDCGKAH